MTFISSFLVDSKFIHRANFSAAGHILAVSDSASMWVPNLPVTILSATCATAGFACLFKDMYGGPLYDRDVPAEGKTVVVTGANSGIGKEVAYSLAQRGAKVFMACRDMEKCEAARREIVSETRNKYVYCRPCDLASSASVAAFVERLKSEEPHVHVLVNNAGVMEPPERVTRDGFEAQLGVNHLGHFLLTNLMLDTLQESAPSRVVILTSSVHRKGRIHKDDLNLSQKPDPRAAYAQSKLANLLFARELAKRTLNKGVSVIAVDPGLSDTGLSRHLPLWSGVARWLVYPLFWPVMKAPRVAAQVVLHAALDPKLEQCAGDYYVDMKKVEPSPEAQDYETANWLWRVSEKWTKLADHKQAVARALAA